MSVYGPSYTPAVYAPIKPSAEHERLMAEGLAKIENMKSNTLQNNLLSNRGPNTPSALRNLDINALIRQMSKPTTTTNKQITVNKQMASPELENMYNNMLGQINELSENTTNAFNQKQGTYTDLLTSLANMFNRSKSGAENSAIGSALASGLTPLEASALAQDAGLNILQSYFPQRATLRSEQADVGIGLQQALQGLLQGTSMPLLQGLIAPYLSGVAGTRGTTTQTQKTPPDPSALLSLLSSYSQQGSSQQPINMLDMLRLQQEQEQFNTTTGLKEAQLAQDWQKTLLNKQLQESLLGSKLENAYNLNQMDEAGALQRLLLSGMLKTPETSDKKDNDYEIFTNDDYMALRDTYLFN